MNRLPPHELAAFARRYRFPGAALRRMAVLHRGPSGIVSIVFKLTARRAVKDLSDAAERVRLTFRLDGVEEFRLQMRPGQPKAKVADARISYLNGLFFVNLDAWGLEPNEQPKVFDYRASEVYAAGRELLWEEEARGGDKEKGRQGE